MPSYFVYHAHSDTATQAGMPATADIVQATRGDAVHTLLAGTSGLVSLVGPTPRIVRSTSILSVTAGFHTDVAELIEVDNQPGYDPQPAAQAVADTITQQLQASDSSWQQGTITPWDQATNGSIAWWQCSGSTPDSCASVTMTRDAIQQGFGRTAPDENPIGPTTSASHPGGILPSGSDVTSALTTVLWVVGGAVALYIFSPFIMPLLGMGRARASAAASRLRKNPRRSRRRHRRLRGAGYRY